MDFFSVNDGILISFSSMKAVFYDSERDTITFEPGITWADAVAGLESEGVAAVGARFRCGVIDYYVLLPELTLHIHLVT